ncbi:MAG: aldehyde dehydrogenase [Proteobacteria bacterium]|nr:aldehyde dehydrogenase [Pseudomonadota bacterium]
MKRDLCAGLVRRHLDPRAVVYCALGTSSRTWRAQQAPQLSYYGSDPMGIALSTALGLALARPERPVLFIGGDGDLVMGLGSLLTVVGADPGNLKLLIFDNGRYETGGAQLLAGSGRYALDAIARGAGFPWASRVEADDSAEAVIRDFLVQPGLAFLAVGIDQEASPYPPAPALSQVEERALFMSRLAALPD